jgi:hypothetical protein
MSVAYSPDGRFIAGGGGREIAVYNVAEDYRHCWTIHTLPGGDGVTLYHDETYAGSPGGLKYLTYRDKLAVYAASDLPELQHA